MKSHLYDHRRLRRPLCGTHVPWIVSPSPDEAETCESCERILSARDTDRYGS